MPRHSEQEYLNQYPTADDDPKSRSPSPLGSFLGLRGPRTGQALRPGGGEL